MIITFVFCFEAIEDIGKISTVSFFLSEKNEKRPSQVPEYDGIATQVKSMTVAK